MAGPPCQGQEVGLNSYADAENTTDILNPFAQSPFHTFKEWKGYARILYLQLAVGEKKKKKKKKQHQTYADLRWMARVTFQ